MKPTGRADKPEQNPSSAIEGHLQSVGLDLETTIFSTSGRGRTFFLTSLFIELIDRVLNETAYLRWRSWVLFAAPLCLAEATLGFDQIEIARLKVLSLTTARRLLLTPKGSVALRNRLIPQGQESPLQTLCRYSPFEVRRVRHCVSNAFLVMSIPEMGRKYFACLKRT